MILGITGGTGCGKTTLLNQIRALGGVVIDCDAVYHRLLSQDPELNTRLKARFPQCYDGSTLNRKQLGALVFGDPSALEDLDKITHAAVRAEVCRLLADQRPELAAIDAYGLFEAGLDKLCHRTVAVTAPREVRIQRLIHRDGITPEYAASRIDAQHTADWYAARCDAVLENSGSLAEFEKKCLAFFEKSGIMVSDRNRRTTVSSVKTIQTLEDLSMTVEELRESLLTTNKNGYTKLTAEQRQEMEEYCGRYSAFIDSCKTEREATTWATAAAEAAGFKPAVPGMEVKPGDKIYLNNRGKSFLIAVVGNEPLSKGANICAAHVDSPRMDLKPNPLYEDTEIAYFKTHYYGGIKKYQWTCVPLAIHGIVCKQDGSTVTVTIGEDENDPILVVSDLLPHLAADQMKKTLAEGIAGEQLNVILGSEPLTGEGSDLVKLNIMRLLNEKYGITKYDFRTAELTIVPAGKCREVGLDRSLLGAYGHDDRVCAYAEIEPILSLPTPTHTAVCILADKEEIGSVGISGMNSRAFEYFMGILCDGQGVKLAECFANSFCLSADVSNAFDPNFAETCDRRNNAMVNYGVSIMKYTGSRGKGGASDASAEAMQHVRSTLDNAGVLWQTSTLGKVDQGGGGTVAGCMANRNIVTVDAGVPVLCMHAPMELVSKLDCYITMLACKAIYLA